jgi:transposase
LERIDEVLNPDPICPDCGGGIFRKIADDISESLEYIPSSFKVIRHIRPRCACINCEKIVQAYPASKPIAKGMAGPGLLAHILVQKYCNHLPFYRQSEIYAREGIELSRSTMASWAGQCSALLTPLVEEIRKYIFTSSHIHGDDTTVRVLAPGLGKTKIGRLWTYVRDGRKYGDEDPSAACYFYSPDRKGIRPEELLKNFTGVFHADAYAGYNNVYIGGANEQAKITEAACWAHTRRKFYEVTVTNSNANIAIKTLEEIGQIYKIEEAISGLSPDKRYKARQERSKDLVEKLFINWKKYLKELPKKSATALAINYALNNEIALKRFLDDGKIEIDNNAAERAMRSVALSRKNWLFAGSDRGGETAASIFTIIETAKLNGINPQVYLKEVLKRIQDHNAKKIVDLLPWNLKLI